MSTDSRRSVSVVAGDAQASMSSGQREFNTLIKQIERRRQQLAAWDAIEPQCQRKYTDELLPLDARSVTLRETLVYRLDEAFEWEGLTNAERRTMSRWILGLVERLLSTEDDTALKAIYNKHSGSDYDSEAASELDGVRAMLEAALGEALGDDDNLNSREALLQRAHAKLAARQQKRERRQAKRKKSAKQIASEARKESEQATISLSIREVYRKLASALHPDREPDAQERVRKTELMQRVNQAYDKKNLLQLLELQLELEQIDQGAINNISEQRLEHYNAVLRDQLGELEQEIRHVQGRLRHIYGVSSKIDLSPQEVLQQIVDEITVTKACVDDLERDLLLLADVPGLKRGLKDVKRRLAQ